MFRFFIFKPHNKYEYADTYWGFDMKIRFRSEWFNEITYMEYEGHQMPVPKMYDEFLTCLYGDYMTPPPPEKRNGGHNILHIDLENGYEKYIH